MTALYRTVATAFVLVWLILSSPAVRADTLVNAAPTDSSQNGLFFDVTALNTVTIHGLDSQIGIPGAVGRPYLVYGRTGTHVGFETSSAGWTLIDSGTTTGGSVQALLSDAFIVVPAGQSYAFYVTTDGDFAENLRYRNNGTAVGAVVVADANLQIRTGTAVNAPFTLTPALVGRDFVGSITYSPGVVAPPVPSLSEWAMIILSLLLASGAVVTLQRRRRILS